MLCSCSFSFSFKGLCIIVPLSISPTFFPKEKGVLIYRLNCASLSSLLSSKLCTTIGLILSLASSFSQINIL